MAEGDLVPDDMSKSELRREANYRASKAGYPVTESGKRKPLRILTTMPAGTVKYNLWPRDEQGNLID